MPKSQQNVSVKGGAAGFWAKCLLDSRFAISKRRTLFAVGLVLLSSQVCQVSVGQDGRSQSNPPKPNPLKPNLPQTLVVEGHDYAAEAAALNARSHVRRELASQRLLSGGKNAIAVLEPMLDSNQLELRLSAADLLESLRHQQLEMAIARLLGSEDVREQIDLPGWRLFKEMAGTSRGSRQLYARLVRQHRHSLQWLDSLKEKPDGAVESAYLEMDRYLPVDIARINDGDPARWSLLLIASSQPSFINAPILSSRVRGGLLNPAVSVRLKESPHFHTLRKLIASWLDATRQYFINSTTLRISLVYQCDEQAESMASSVLRDRNSAPAVVASSLTLLARLQPEAAKAECAKWLDDSRVCHVWQVVSVRHRAVQTEVRDVALAMLLYLNGHDPRTFGFEDLEGDPDTIFRDFSMGFEHDAARGVARRASLKVLSPATGNSESNIGAE